MLLGKKKQIPLFLLSGFLGAGKTTMLKGMLEQLSGKKIGCVQNEFGEVGIDGAFVQRDGLSLFEINNGSIFCSCRRDQFEEALASLSGRGLDFVFIECSGMSDPSSIEGDISGMGETVRSAYDFKGSVCVVDALNFIGLLNVLETVRRQVKFSNFIIINKSDLADARALLDVERTVREINPDAPIFRTTYCRLPFEKLVSAGLPAMPQTEDSTNTPKGRPGKLLLVSERTVSKDALVDFLQKNAEKTFRIKGFCRLPDGWNYVDCVMDRISVSRTDLKRERTELVVILNGSEKTIKRIEADWNIACRDQPMM